LLRLGTRKIGEKVNCFWNKTAALFRSEPFQPRFLSVALDLMGKLKKGKVMCRAVLLRRSWSFSEHQDDY